METSLLELVANMGFPCVVTMYLLVRIEAKFDKLSDCMNELTISIRENNRGWIMNFYIKNASISAIPKNQHWSSKSFNLFNLNKYINKNKWYYLYFFKILPT